MASDKEFSLVFRGEVALDHDPLATQQKLAQALKAPVEKIPLLFSGKPFTVKKGLSFEDGLKLQRQILQIGAITYVEPSTVNSKPAQSHSQRQPNGSSTRATSGAHINAPQKLDLTLAPIEPTSSNEPLDSLEPNDSIEEKDSFSFERLKLPPRTLITLLFALIGLSLILIFSPYPDLVVRKGFVVGGILLFFSVLKLKN